VASHIGVELGIPTIGVAKNLHLLAEEGEIFQKGELFTAKLALLQKKVK
jgi:deoxyinosine 3'endonuclease (endonuclease V)